MSYDRIDIHEHNEGEEILSIGIIILLVLFFPIGVILLIVRSISKTSKRSAETKEIKASTERIHNDISDSQAEQIAKYHALYKMGAISQQEYEAKKMSLMQGKKMSKTMQLTQTNTNR